MWMYEQPVTIGFGKGAGQHIAALMEQHGWKRGIIVATPHAVKNGIVRQLMAAGKDSITAVFSHITPNPDVCEVDECAAVMRREQSDVVMAIGGGSAMDLAKAAASICLTDESIQAYHGTGKSLPLQHVPLIAVPTTAGTGSEVTSVAVLSNHALKKKAPVVSTNFFPDYAVIDPELTYDMPPYLTACCGIDVLSHALEGYWSIHHQPVCDACAVHAASLVFRYLLRAYAQPDDKEARDKMCEASVMAGLAFTLPKTTASHACSFPLTNIYGIPHGEACGLTLDYFTRLNGQSDHRVGELAGKLGFADCEALADAIVGLKQRLHLRCDLKDLHLTGQQVDDLVRISHHPNMDNNPVVITDAILYDLYEHML
ncbi:MAG: iron-containing alcohol dehydrogenase family protein [Megasphaera sp.]|jgi:alcohol dehydrogenase|nr:iron-containing alcohol dehydrogenase family protein [Megasphaera sp.]MCH4187688.1 iron-containing alcohol dehydrogenase family protein [Megasphaera sp.]MCH4217587.1 iron-containing alcohol dehydrogenase family protein [Megasphaera sp.]